MTTDEETREVVGEEVDKIEEVDDDKEEGESKEPTVPEVEKSVEELETELAEMTMQAAEYLGGWQRAKAEFANYRKRQEEQAGQLRDRITEEIILDLLPVMDDVQLAFSNLPEELKTEEKNWLDGFLMIEKKLNGLLEKQGVREIETQGQEFDPNLHEAVTAEESEDFEEGQVIADVRKGYRLGERVLRPAMVRVAK